MKKPTAASDQGYSPFEVVVVPFPYSVRLAEKRRPALVVSAPELSRRYGLLWLAMITSSANPRWECDIDLDIAAAGLPAPSRVRPAKIATVDSSRIVRTLGRLAKADAEQVRKALRSLLAG
jgi:mRNA interferase MazF